MGQSYFVYILANRRHGTLYVGVTNDLVRRVHEHKEGVAGGFTKKHSCTHLVWFATHDEKRLKKWHRDWKEQLIEEQNPDWRDLWWDIIGPQAP